MLITESQLGFGTRFESLNLLNNMNYLTEAESVYSPALVPVVENTSVGAHLIRLEDIVSFSEANGIEDLGYALSLVCESSEVDPQTVAFTVQEENIIADENLADLTYGIMEAGVGVIAKPLNENNPMAVLTNVAVNYLIETGDDIALNMLCENPLLLVEAMMTPQERAAAMKGLSGNDLTEYKRMAGEVAKGTGKYTRKDLDNYLALYTTDANTKSDREHFEVTGKGKAQKLTSDFYKPGEENLIVRGGGTKLADAEARAYAENPAAYNQQQKTDANGKPVATKKSKEELNALKERLKNSRNEKGQTGKGAPGSVEQAESFLDKVKSYANKGRDAIAAVIAKINSWIRSIEADHTKTGVWNTIVGRLKQALNWLTSKMHNAIASDAREKL